jgi:hypothetical protein
MATDFIQLGDTLVNALIEPDVVKRKLEIESWLDSAVPILQAGLREQLRQYIHETINKGVSERKARQYVFRLAMQFNLERASEREKLQVLTSVAGTVAPLQQNTMHDDGDDDSRMDRSSNDDRSDSLNPNNDAYNAAMDNHANQLNPNNDAYWSSRGR